MSASVKSHPDSTRADKVPVVVVLPNEEKLLIPLRRTSTVFELLEKAIQRATALGGAFQADQCVLRHGGRQGGIVFGEDEIEDVLCLGELEFYLTIKDENRRDILAPAIVPKLVTPSNTSPTNNTATPPQTSDSTLSIRFITEAAALKHETLRSVPIWGTVDLRITVQRLAELALEWLRSKQPLADTIADIWVPLCYLGSSEPKSDSPTLMELELSGTEDVFITLRRKDEWPFEASKRGIACFYTSLKAGIRSIEKKQTDLDALIELLWELTHFPPVLLSMCEVLENGIQPRSCAIIASMIKNIAENMVPQWITTDSNCLLEASRQILAWLFTTPSEASAVYGTNQRLVHRVELQIQDEPATELFGRFDHNEFVDLKIGSMQRVHVSKDHPDHVEPLTLALFMHSSYATPFNYYFIEDATYLDHDRQPLLHPSDFDNILMCTNQIEHFRMFGPLSLGNAPKPVITLDREGYVSLFDTKGEKTKSFTWNHIRGEDTFEEGDAGQIIMQKLEPLIAQRRDEGTWELDAWDEEAMTAEQQAPEEGIVICVDRSSSMETTMLQSWAPRSVVGGRVDSFSRMSEVKNVFQNFATRVYAYKLPVQVGLVSFCNQTEVKTEKSISPIQNDFHLALEAIQPSGCTALWDAIWKAKDMLVNFKEKRPNVKLRIIALTDGEDNNSEYTAASVCSQLYDNNIVLDTIVIGTTSTTDLFRIAKHTGGYAFNPATRSLLNQIVLLENFLDIRTRPDVIKIPVGIFYKSTPKTGDMINAYSFPPLRLHDNFGDNFFSLKDARTHLRSLASRSNASHSVQSGTTSTTIGGRRAYLREINELLGHPHDHMDIYISERNMGFWKVVMRGPPASAYEAGIFLLLLELGDSFPLRPPSVRFITPVLHPNITKHGRICHQILDEKWTSSTHAYEVLQHIWGLLTTMEARDAVDPLVSIQFWTDMENAKKEVSEYIQRFAQKGRDQFRMEILGEPIADPAPGTEHTSHSYTPNQSVPFVSSAPPSYSYLSVRPTSTRSSTSSVTLTAVSDRTPISAASAPAQVHSTPAFTNTSQAAANAPGRRGLMDHLRRIRNQSTRNVLRRR